MILFFTRKFNDVDHLVPVAHALATRGESDIEFLSMNPSYPIHADYRLKFLRDTHGISSRYVYEAHTPTLAHTAMAGLLCGDGSGKPQRWGPARVVRGVYGRWVHPRLYEPRLKGALYGPEWAADLIRQYRPRALVFDWVKAHQWVTGSLAAAAKRAGVPTFSLPHGLPWFANDRFTVRQAQEDAPLDYGRKFGQFDRFVVPFDAMAKRAIATGLDPDKIAVLGSARFCREWDRVHAGLRKEVPLPESLRDDGRLRVLYLDAPAMYRIRTAAVSAALERMASLPFVHLVVKPHTRSNVLSDGGLKGRATIARDIPSVDLFQWADVIVGTTSSVLLEAYSRDKVLVYPKHLHDNTMIFEEHGACWTVRSDDELAATLTTLRDDSGARPYGSAEVESLLTDVVRGGVRDRDVLRTYAGFIVENARAGN